MRSCTDSGRISGGVSPPSSGSSGSVVGICSSVVAMTGGSVSVCLRQTTGPQARLPSALHVDEAAGPPVLPVVPGEELLVDEVAPQRRVIVMEPCDDLVHLALGVPPADVELQRDPVEDDQSLG